MKRWRVGWVCRRFQQAMGAVRCQLKWLMIGVGVRCRCWSPICVIRTWEMAGLDGSDRVSRDGCWTSLSAVLRHSEAEEFYIISGWSPGCGSRAELTHTHTVSTLTQMHPMPFAPEEETPLCVYSSELMKVCGIVLVLNNRELRATQKERMCCLSSVQTNVDHYLLWIWVFEYFYVGRTGVSFATFLYMSSCERTQMK